MVLIKRDDCTLVVKALAGLSRSGAYIGRLCEKY